MRCSQNTTSDNDDDHYTKNKSPREDGINYTKTYSRGTEKASTRGLCEEEETKTISVTLTALSLPGMVYNVSVDLSVKAAYKIPAVVKTQEYHMDPSAGVACEARDSHESNGQRGALNPEI